VCAWSALLPALVPDSLPQKAVAGILLQLYWGDPPKKYCKRTCVTRVTSFWHTLGLQMTKTELLIAIAQATETNRRTAGVFLETLSALAYKEIKKNGEFVLPGFGKLVKQKRKARTGFNPKTQQKIKIPAKTVVKFRVAKAAKDAVLGMKK
jgi:DNA-binding protein HU-beta